MRARGLNGDFTSSHRPGDFDIDIRNSRDNPDEFGKNPFVSRVVIGGTQAEAALPPGFGALANSVDPGNFRTDDDAVVTLSQVKPVLDIIPIKPPHTRIEMISLALGQLASHVAGHYFGNFTTDRSLTDPFSGLPNIMDNRFTLSRAVGPDGIFGTHDDVDVDLGVDNYFTVEPFRGIEDSLNVVAFGLSTGKGVVSVVSSTSTASNLTAPASAPSSSAAALLESLGLARDARIVGRILTDPDPDDRWLDVLARARRLWEAEEGTWATGLNSAVRTMGVAVITSGMIGRSCNALRLNE